MTARRRRRLREEEPGIIIQINPTMIRYQELEIKTLQEAPRDGDKQAFESKTKRMGRRYNENKRNRVKTCYRD